MYLIAWDYLFQVDSIKDAVQECMMKFASNDSDNIPDNQKADFKKRKLITEVYDIYMHYKCIKYLLRMLQLSLYLRGDVSLKCHLL